MPCQEDPVLYAFRGRWHTASREPDVTLATKLKVTNDDDDVQSSRMRKLSDQQELALQLYIAQRASVISRRPAYAER